MAFYRSSWTRGIVLLFLFVSFAVQPAGTPAFAAPTPEEPSSYTVMFIPSNFFRLCKGDSHTYAFQVVWNEPEEYDPVPVDRNGLPFPVPLNSYKAKVTATNGTVQPSEFLITTTPQTFRFKYTAQSEGTETLQVTLEDGATGQASKTLQIVGACNYNLKFFANQSESVETGSYQVKFQGAGDITLDRTDATANAIKGNGIDSASLGMWAAAPDLFFCPMVPLRSDSTFKIEGTLQPDYGFMTVSLYFDPLTFSGSMHFDCTAVGFESLVFDIPIDNQTSDMKDMNLAGLTFPITGGSDNFKFGKSQGVVVVTQKH